jgi:spore coat polysaccharide biosynthesis predicted glycosyltransferase SpsG
MNVCKEIINLEVISKHLNKLNDLFDDAQDQNEMTVKLAEIIKAKSSANLQQVLKQKILVSGGASDFENFTHEVVKKLMMIDFNFEVCVFSKQPPNFFYDSRFTFKSLGSDLVKEIEGVNLFISTAGTSAFDFLTLGGVLALGCAVENQIENYVQLQVNGLAIGVGECDKNGVWNLDSQKLNSFLADKELQDKLIARSKNLFKGEGAMKITNEILNLVL